MSQVIDVETPIQAILALRDRCMTAEAQAAELSLAKALVDGLQVDNARLRKECSRLEAMLRAAGLSPAPPPEGQAPNPVAPA